MLPISAYHDGTPDLFDFDGDRAQVRLELTGARPEGVWLRSEPDNEALLTPMQSIERDGERSIYAAELILDGSKAVTSYCFKFVIGGEGWWLGATGLGRYPPERAFHFRFAPAYRPATWVWKQIFYQIFPDRFCDGDSDNNVRSGEYRYRGESVVAKAWGDLPDRRQGAREFYGGDLQGIEAKLGYLEWLGVSALYLNPIFTSPSSHKYDTVDYLSVDPHFGGNDALLSLCRALRARGMRLLLDAVVNHTSERHPWFDRYGEHESGAYGSTDSPYRDRYLFGGDDPDSYLGWKGVRTLPVLDYASERLRDDVYRGRDAILRYWLRPPYAIDGWRLDVIHMLGSGSGAADNADHLRAIREAVRAERPDAYLLGEHFSEATNWLQGDQEDGAMNYHGFTRPVQAFLSGRDGHGLPAALPAEDLDRWLTGARAQLPFPIQLSQFNLLDSHDTPRLLTTLGGDIRLLRLAVVALFVYIGVPCIYYGDEIGLEGGPDPDCRRTFPWDETQWNRELQGLYRSLIGLRHSRSELQRGGIRTLYARGDVYAFVRTLGGQATVAILNRGASGAVALPLDRLGAGRGWRDALSGAEIPAAAGADFALEACSARILLCG